MWEPGTVKVSVWPTKPPWCLDEEQRDRVLTHPRVTETGSSGAAGDYVILEYESFEQMNEQLKSDVVDVNYLLGIRGDFMDWYCKGDPNDS